MKLITVSTLFSEQRPGLGPNRPPLGQGFGQATVSDKPDQAKLDVGVVTQAATAQDAAAQNASQVAAVLAQLQTVLGSGRHQDNRLFA